MRTSASEALPPCPEFPRFSIFRQPIGDNNEINNNDNAIGHADTKEGTRCGFLNAISINIYKSYGITRRIRRRVLFSYFKGLDNRIAPPKRIRFQEKSCATHAHPTQFPRLARRRPCTISHYFHAPL